MSRHVYQSRERSERALARRLAREQKEREKLSALEEARLTVQVYEARISELLSLHKQSTSPVDWLGVASLLPPAKPTTFHREANIRARSNLVLGPLGEPLADVESAARMDRIAIESSLNSHERRLHQHQEETGLASRVLSDDAEAFLLVLRESPALLELTEQGERLDFAAPHPRLIECSFFPQSSTVIPAEIQSLTSTGRLASKAMPRAQFFALYQDFICSGLLRIAREVMSTLPVNALMITAFSGEAGDRSTPIISAVVRRQDLSEIDFDHCDPSDTLDGLHCRSKFKATRKAGAFQSIAPFTTEDAIALSDDTIASNLTRAASATDDPAEAQG